MKTFLGKAQQLGELRLFDLQFARHLSEVNNNEVPELLLAAALASNSISHGDTCLSLGAVKSSSLYTNPDLRTVRQKLPSIEQWRHVLLAQKVVCAAPSDDLALSGNDDHSVSDDEHPREQSYQPAPLILDEENRLYLARYWVLEQLLGKSLNHLLDREPPVVDTEKLKHTLSVLFKDGEPDWQKAAVANALVSQFCVITGGPGTGKTYTVTALLAALMDQGVEPRRIALAAPTGKASTRLTQSIQKDLSGLLSKLDLPDAAFESVTLHKLLGSRPGRVQPRYHSGFPLLYDVVIIDEASMIDLPMMARTFDALSKDARIVLIGDKDQLHSVESGMVLGDICGGRANAELSAERIASLVRVGVNKLPVCANPGGRIADRIVYLEKSHRVQDDGGISKLASAVNQGDADAALRLLTSQSSLSLVAQSPQNLQSLLREQVIPACKKYTMAEAPQAALESMYDTGVLCALRRGPTGSIRINALVERLLIEDGAIAQGQSYYHGRPLMVTENSNHQRLYNGDHGVVLHDKHSVPSVYFASDGGVRAISHNRLPQHETFYAMTVHKSQGSEYATVVVVLPEKDSPILSRELLYTAITRARSRVIILANEDQLRLCIERQSIRQSGLREMLWHSAVGQPETVVAEPKPALSSTPVQTQLDF